MQPGRARSARSRARCPRPARTSNPRQRSPPTRSSISSARNDFKAPGRAGCSPARAAMPKRRQQRRERQDQDNELDRVADKPESGKTEPQPAVKQGAITQCQDQAKQHQCRQGAHAPIAHPPYRDGCQQDRPDPGVIGRGPILPILQEYPLRRRRTSGTAAPGNWPSPRTACTSRGWWCCNPCRAGNVPATPGMAAIAPHKAAPPGFPFPESAQRSLLADSSLLYPIPARQEQQDQPGCQYRLRPACQHLHRARHGAPHQRLPAFAPGPLSQPHHPRQPTECRHVARPHQEVK